MFEGLAGSYAIVGVVYQQFLNEIGCLWAHMRDQFGDACPLSYVWKVELHVCSVLLELIQEVFRRGARYIMNLDYLVKFIIAREQWEKR